MIDMYHRQVFMFVFIFSYKYVYAISIVWRNLRSGITQIYKIHRYTLQNVNILFGT